MSNKRTFFLLLRRDSVPASTRMLDQTGLQVVEHLTVKTFFEDEV